VLHQFSRNELAIGREGLEALRQSTAAVLGIGGVGSFAAEALARSGIGRLILIDKDVVDITNINRQIHALMSTIGQPKADLMKERIRQINPACEVIALKMFYTEETCEDVFAHAPIDYFLDASDTVTYKIHLIKECLRRGIPVISSMGAANKMDPTRLRVADISETCMDPIARVVRKKLREAGIRRGVKVVFSTEVPIKPRADVTAQIVPENAPAIRKAQMPPSSNAFVPSVAGLIMAGVVVRDILDKHGVDIPRVPH